PPDGETRRRLRTHRPAGPGQLPRRPARPPGPGRRPEEAGRAAPAEGPGGEAPLLRRPFPGGDGPDARHRPRDRPAALGLRPGLAVWAAEPGLRKSAGQW